MNRRISARVAMLWATLSLVGAACGSPTPTAGPSGTGPSGAPGTSPAASANPSGAPAATPAASGGTIVGDAVVPAGVQYLEPATASPWGLPANASWGLFASRAAGDTEPSLAAGQDASSGTVAAVRTGTTWRRAVLASTKSIKGPAGYYLTNWVQPTALAASASGFLVVGDSVISDAGHNAISGLGFAWFSTDGAQWAQTDFRGVFGAKAYYAPTAAIATGSGWLVAGALTDRTQHAKSQLVVLASADGTTWHEVSRLKDTWTLTSPGLAWLGDKIALTGIAWICATQGFEQYVGIGNPVLRVWTSGDQGSTWTAGDGTAGGANVMRAPAPTGPSGCSGIMPGQLSSYPKYLGVVNGRAVVVSEDHTRVATSADLATWTVGDLPGGKAKVGSGPGSGMGGTGNALAAVPDGQATVILSLEARRDDTDTTGPFGLAVIAWRTTDGSAWTRQPAARPVEITGAARFIAAPDGSVYLEDQLYLGTGAMYRHSVAGKVVTQLACQPGPHADCSFTTVSGSLAGADLTGIDLYGSVIASDADLSGAKLVGSKLTGLSVLTGASLKGADLTGASASRIDVAKGVVIAGANLAKADLSSSHIASAGSDAVGVNLSGANLTNASIPGVDLRGGSLAGTLLDRTSIGTTILSADLTGATVKGVLVYVGVAGAPDALEGYDFGTRNLAGWFFANASYKGSGDLRGADFSRAGVAGLGLDNVDLTGAKFPPGATSQLDVTQTTAIYFSTTLICPDGQPPTKVGYEGDCRLPK